jgi:hypothetical protein
MNLENNRFTRRELVKGAAVAAVTGGSLVISSEATIPAAAATVTADETIETQIVVVGSGLPISSILSGGSQKALTPGYCPSALPGLTPGYFLAAAPGLSFFYIVSAEY